MRRHLFSICGLCLMVLAIAGCNSEPPPVMIDLSRKSDVTAPTAVPNSQTPTLRLGIGSMITPKEGYIYYRRLTDYLEKHLGRPVTIVDRGTYREFNALLASGSLDLAFVCGGPYVEGHADFGLRLLVVPQTPAGETVYYSYLIAPEASPARSLDDLRGGKFAFTDPQSNTGFLVPTYMLARLGEAPETFFEETVFTYAHDKSIQAVAAGRVDGAAVDSLIYDYLAGTSPELIGKVKVLAKSKPYGIPPVVVRPDLPEADRERLRRILLTMHEDLEGQSILAGMLIGRFVTSDDAAYDGIREIEAFIHKAGDTGR